jgi:lysophospholipase L1-like esterase
MSTVKIAIVGDSNCRYTAAPYGDLGAKLVTALNALYPATTYTVANVAVDGSSSTEALAGFSSQVAPITPQVVIFAHGTNDYWVHSTTPAQYETNIRQYKALLDAVVSDPAQYLGHPLLLLLDAPGSAAYEGEMGFPSWRGDLFAYRSVMAALGTEWGTPVAGWYASMTAGRPNWKTDYLVDGVHVNAACKDLAVAAIVAALLPFLTTSGVLGNGYPVDINGAQAWIAPERLSAGRVASIFSGGAIHSFAGTPPTITRNPDRVQCY